MRNRVKQVEPMRLPVAIMMLLGAVLAMAVLSGCSAPVQSNTGTSPQAPSLINNQPPLDVNRYVQLASGSGTGKTVGVIVNPEKTGLIWQGGPDISAIVSWEAKLADGTVLTGGSSAPGIGQFDGFGEDIRGKYLIITARFSDGYEQVLLSTMV
jgi:hypothetical protein